ncbi:MAG: hypothetical protein LH473_06200, partial [Chitinophagales bacterium]|nr:hypothetical protein [Chitinophagales bacterium]
MNNEIKISGTKSLFIDNTSTSSITLLGNLLSQNAATDGGGSILITISGSGKQKIEDNQTGSNYGRLPSLKINKTNDTLSLVGEFGLGTGKSWEYVNGNVNAGTSKVYCFGQNTLTNSSSLPMNFYDMEFAGNDNTINKTVTINHTCFTSGTTDCKINGGVTSGTLELIGDLQWNNSSAANFGNVSWKISGINIQTFTGSVTPVFSKMEINKSDKYFILKKAISISSQLTMTNGFIVSDSINTVTIQNGATILNASATSFIRGSVKKIGNSAFKFPIGVGWKYRPIEISAPALATDIFTATYYSSAQNFGTNKDVSLTYLSGCEYWNLVRTAGASSVTVQLLWDNLTCDIDTLPTLRIAKYNSSTLKWNNTGGVTTTGDSLNGNVITNAAQSAFGYFVIAKSSQLPVVNEGNNITACAGTRIKLGGNPTASGGTPTYNYTWTPTTNVDSANAANSFVTVYSSMDFVVTVIDKDNAIVSDTIHVTVNSSPIVNAGADRVVTIGGSTVLGGTPAVTGGNLPYTYLWSPSAYLVQNNIEHPAAIPFSNMAYSLQATDANGCTGNDIVNVLLNIPSLGRAGMFGLLAADSIICNNTILVSTKVGSRKFISENIHSTDTITINSNYDSLAIADLDSAIIKIKSINGIAITPELGGATLYSGFYKTDLKATINGTLTLSGNAQSVFIFNLNDSLVISDGAEIKLDGINRSQVLFRVGKEMIVNGNVNLAVNILAEKNIIGGAINNATLMSKGKIIIESGTFSPSVYEAKISSISRNDAAEFLGYSSSNVLQPSGQYPSHLSDANVRLHLPTLNGSVFRFPQGGISKEWNSIDGWYISPAELLDENSVLYAPSLSCIDLESRNKEDQANLPVDRLLELKYCLGGSGMKLLLPLNIFTNINFQKNIIQHALDLKINVPYVELGNEFYLKNATCNTQQPEDYAAIVNEYLNMVHSNPNFNGIKIGIVGSSWTIKDDVTDNSGCRRKTWNSGMLPHLAGTLPHDAITFHLYPDCGIDRTKSPNVTLEDIPVIFNKAYSVIDTFANHELSLLNSYPDLDAWVTEYNMNEKLFKIHGSWTQSLFFSIITLRMLEFEKIKFATCQTFVNDATRGMLFNNSKGYSLFSDFESIDPTLYTQPWAYTASGLSMKMIADAMRYSTNANMLNFPNAPRLENSNYPTIYGWTFDKELGDKQSILINLSAETQAIDITHLLPASAYEQISCKNPLTFITGKVWWNSPYNGYYNSVEHNYSTNTNAPANFDSVNIKIPANKSVIYLPPYSITRLYVLNQSSVWLRQTDDNVCAKDENSFDKVHSSTAVNLYASGGASYQWTLGDEVSSQQSSISVGNASALANGSLKVFDTEGNLIGQKNNIAVDVLTLPAVTVVPTTFSNSNFANSFTATATGGVNYNWSPTIGLSSVTGNTVTIVPPATKTYQVIGIADNGCAKIAKVVANISPSVSIKSSNGTMKNSLSPPTLTICNGEPITLYADGSADDYQWSSSDGSISSTGPSVTFIAVQQMLVTLTSTDNVKQKTSHSTLLINLSPDVAIKWLDQYTCPKTFITLKSTMPGYSTTFSWDDGKPETLLYDSKDSLIPIAENSPDT